MAWSLIKLLVQRLNLYGLQHCPLQHIRAVTTATCVLRIHDLTPPTPFLIAPGAAWPLIELLVQQLDQYGLQHCPLLYVSPAAKGSLALACTSSEFLSRCGAEWGREVGRGAVERGEEGGDVGGTRSGGRGKKRSNEENVEGMVARKLTVAAGRIQRGQRGV